MHGALNQWVIHRGKWQQTHLWYWCYLAPLDLWIQRKKVINYTSQFKMDLSKIDGRRPFWTSSNLLSHASNISTSIMSKTNGFPYLQNKALKHWLNKLNFPRWNLTSYSRHIQMHFKRSWNHYQMPDLAACTTYTRQCHRFSCTCHLS